MKIQIQESELLKGFASFCATHKCSVFGEYNKNSLEACPLVSFQQPNRREDTDIVNGIHQLNRENLQCEKEFIKLAMGGL